MFEEKIRKGNSLKLATRLNIYHPWLSALASCATLMRASMHFLSGMTWLRRCHCNRVHTKIPKIVNRLSARQLQYADSAALTSNIYQQRGLTGQRPFSTIEQALLLCQLNLLLKKYSYSEYFYSNHNQLIRLATEIHSLGTVNYSGRT